jgi:hypothetical protein
MIVRVLFYPANKNLLRFTRENRQKMTLDTLKGIPEIEYNTLSYQRNHIWKASVLKSKQARLLNFIK